MYLYIYTLYILVEQVEAFINQSIWLLLSNILSSSPLQDPPDFFILQIILDYYEYTDILRYKGGRLKNTHAEIYTAIIFMNMVKKSTLLMLLFISSSM